MDKIIPRKISYKELRDGSYRDAYVPQDEKFEGGGSKYDIILAGCTRCMPKQ